MKTVIYGQLGNFKMDVDVPADGAKGEARVTLSGKGGGKKDDLLICLMLALHFSSKKRLESSFRATAKAHGWRY